jgi:ornithine carbamoyltransferase
MLGVNLNIASPEGYQLPPRVVQQATEARPAGAACACSIRRGCGGRASTPCTPTPGRRWGRRRGGRRRRAFAAYQVNDALMALARPGALFMHLPAGALRRRRSRRTVFESAASIVFDQAENRLHAQKALLLMLLYPSGPVTNV